MPKQREWYVDADDPQWARQWVDGQWSQGRVHVFRLNKVHGAAGGPQAPSPSGAGAPAPLSQSNRERNYRVVAAILAVASVVALVAYGISLHNNGVRAEREEVAASKAAVATEAPGVSYRTTRCSDWTDSFDDAQRYTMAADVLTALRDRESGYTGVPGRSLVLKYEAEITSSCSAGPSVLATQAAALIYLSDSRFGYRP